MDVVINIECGSKDLCIIYYYYFTVARMDSLHDEVSKLMSEKRKRKRKDNCLNSEKGLEQELLFLRGKQRSKAAPSSSVSSHCRVYTCDTSVRKGGTVLLSLSPEYTGKRVLQMHWRLPQHRILVSVVVVHRLPQVPLPPLIRGRVGDST